MLKLPIGALLHKARKLKNFKINWIAKGGLIMDALLLLGAFLICLLLPFMYFKLWLWAIYWLSIAVMLAIMELVSYLKFGKTLSQQIWHWEKTEPKAKVGKWILMAGMIGFWGFLLVHLFLHHVWIF